MKQLPTVIFSRDGAVGIELVHYDGIRGITNRSAYGCHYRVQSSLGFELNRITVVFADTPDRVRLHAYDLPNKDDDIATIQIYAQAAIGDFLDEHGLPPFTSDSEADFQIDCFRARFKAWRAREPAADSEIEQYIRSALYWSWRFAHDEVELSASDVIRLRTTLPQLNRIIKLSEDIDWKVEERDANKLIISPMQSLLRAERDRRVTTPIQLPQATTPNYPIPDGLRLFISHSSKDHEYVKALVYLIRSALNLPAEQIRCTSVDGYRLPGGADTQETLRREIHTSEAFIGVISEHSLQSAYVTFELGARWGAKKHLIPLLAPGMNAQILSGPLTDISALQGDSPAQVQQLARDLASQLNVEPSPPASYQHQLDALLTTVATPGLNARPLRDSTPYHGSDLQTLRRSPRQQVARILYAEIQNNTEHLEEIRDTRRTDPEIRPMSWPATQPGYQSLGSAIGELDLHLTAGIMSYYRGLETIGSIIADFAQNPKVDPRLLRDFDRIVGELIAEGQALLQDLEEEASSKDGKA